jgi:hypothetical protein
MEFIQLVQEDGIWNPQFYISYRREIEAIKLAMKIANKEIV